MTAMEPQNENIPRIVQLAQQVERDIRQRGLHPGDPYLTTAQTARMLGVSTTIANRALQYLARNGRLDRRQRRGTFVAEPDRKQGEPAIARVHLVVHQRYMRTEGLLADGVIVGLQSELPGLDVSFNFMPPGSEAEYVNELIGTIMQSGQPEGLVLVRASLEVQRIVAQSGLPAVVYGTPYRSISQLSYVDADQHAVGRLLTEHALAQRCKRLLVIMRDQMLPGDSPYLDAILETAGNAGLTADRIRTRFLPRDRELIAAEVRHLLEKKRPRPAILCRDEPLADATLAEVERLGLRAGHDMVVTVSTIYRRGNEAPPPIPYTQYAETPVQIGEHLARLLTSSATQQETRSPKSIILPVTLCDPSIAP
jgi:DNA-binding LacI/PurR family transcriptional regulator/DNA-binding transcriptional regulator YhcF (GntR family)